MQDPLQVAQPRNPLGQAISAPSSTPAQPYVHTFARLPSDGSPTVRTHVPFIEQSANSLTAPHRGSATGARLPAARRRVRGRWGARPGRLGGRSAGTVRDPLASRQRRPAGLGGSGGPARAPTPCGGAAPTKAASPRCAGASRSRVRLPRRARALAPQLIAQPFGGLSRPPARGAVARPAATIAEKRHEPPQGAARLRNKPAASYSPRPLRAKYHRR
jgi:hypothetical protein